VPEHTRRELALALGAIPFLLGAGEALARTGDDTRILARAIELELRAALAYSTAVASGRLDAATTGTFRGFGQQAQRHADALAQGLRRLGGRVPAGPRRAAEVPGLTEAVQRGQAATVSFALELEDSLVAYYYDALGKLRDPGVVSTAASIMANEGQHLVVLREALGTEPLPDAFETGRR
jgi:rubrerythrin